MDKDELAALDRAARDADESGDGELAYALNRQFAGALMTAYRAKQVVLIGPDAVEKVARAIASTSADAWKYLHVSTDPKDWEFEARAALAALGVK